MRLIDADKVVEYCCGYFGHCTQECTKCGFANSVRNIPTAFDVDEVLGHLQSEHDKWTKGVEQVQAMGLDDLRRNLSGRAFGVSEAIKIIEIEKMKQQLKFWPLELDNVIKMRWNK